MRWPAATALVLLALGSGCASARMSDHEPDRLFREGRYDAAAELLAKRTRDGGPGAPGKNDELLYLLDLGLSLHSAGKYAESNQAFTRADQLAEINDYTSLAAETSTLLVSDNAKVYKGEEFENVLISTYMAMNYTLMGDVENALVEARRVNRKLELMITEGKRKYKQNAFARYLSAMLYEAEGNWSDAYIDYKKTYELQPDFPFLGRDLWRMAAWLGMGDETDRWDETLHLTAADHVSAREMSRKGGQGEIIVLYENGISPIKKPNPSFRSLPKFYARYNPVREADVVVDGNSQGGTAVLDNVEATAIQNLDEKYGAIIAKKIGGVVAKEVTGDIIARQTRSPLLGALAKLALYATDEADLRSWNLLPRDLQVARFAVAPGQHTVLLKTTMADLPAQTVTVVAGKKVFLDFRYMP